MADGETVELELDLDAASAEKTLEMLLDNAESLKEMLWGVGKEMTKLFTTLQKSIEKAMLNTEGLSAALVRATAAMEEFCASFSAEGITTVGEQILGVFGDVIGSIAGVLTEFSLKKWGNAILVWLKTIVSGLLSCVDDLAVVNPKIAAIVAIVAAIVGSIIAIVQNWDTISAAVKTFFEETLPQAWAQFFQWLSNIGAGIAGFFTDIWNEIEPIGSAVVNWLHSVVLQPIIDGFNETIRWFGALFGSLWQTASDIFYNISVIINGCFQVVAAVWEEMKGVLAGAWNWMQATILKPLGTLFSNIWEGFVNGAKIAWEAVKNVFSQVAGFFRSVFEKAWQGVVTVFSVAGEIFINIRDGILAAFKKIVNGLITGINAVVKIPFDGINSVLGRIRDVKIMDITPFAGIKTVSVPKIPYLAQGAVLPANQPFLAMVGDQKHGTNIEAPLSTIQEAVAITMGDQLAALQAGFDATVAELQMLRRTVGAIQVGDTVIGQAAQRYNDSISLLRGSAY